jgi:type III secretory pathway component EscV
MNLSLYRRRGLIPILEDSITKEKHMKNFKHKVINLEDSLLDQVVEMATKIAEHLGVTVPDIEVRDDMEGVWGKYNLGTNILQINEDVKPEYLLEVVAHEMKHHEQEATGKVVVFDDHITWNGSEYSFFVINFCVAKAMHGLMNAYLDLPWERDANDFAQFWCDEAAALAKKSA